MTVLSQEASTVDSSCFILRSMFLEATYQPFKFEKRKLRQVDRLDPSQCDFFNCRRNRLLNYSNCTWDIEFAWDKQWLELENLNWLSGGYTAIPTFRTTDACWWKKNMTKLFHNLNYIEIVLTYLHERNTCIVRCSSNINFASYH